MTTVLIKEPLFYCYQDEEHFFGWLKGLKALKELKRTSKGLALTFEHPIDDASLADLTGLFTRYRIDRSQLKVFCNEANRHWFARSRRTGIDLCFQRHR